MSTSLLEMVCDAYGRSLAIFIAMIPFSYRLDTDDVDTSLLLFVWHNIDLVFGGNDL